MSSEDYTYVEQDTGDSTNEDGLPTYDDLIVQHGPNSRFGRWRGWIEKRAAERYADISPQERSRRRERGWGNDNMYGSESSLDSPSIPTLINQPPSPSPMALHIQTDDLRNLHISQRTQHTLSPPLPPLPSVSLKLQPTHLRIHQFGSRFLPHATSPIRCVLSIMEGKLLLIGHDEGLSVLDMYPRSESVAGISVKGPEEAQARSIWTGEGIFQMSLLEMENDARGTAQGVVLALVGPEVDSPSTSSKDSESTRVLRMYNLTSLISLAKWTINQKGARPLDMRRPSNWQSQQQTPPKRHRPQHSIARGLKNLIDTPGNHHGSEHSQSSSYQTLLSPSPSVDSTTSRTRSRPNSPRADSFDSASWDMIDELPLRWATDFVPLATPGSRLSTSSVLSYALWSNDDRPSSRGGRLLAIATKSNIFLYETPKGERAFHFLKEFYTPLIPRSITFFQQSVSDIARSFSDSGYRSPNSHKRADSSINSRDTHRLSSTASMTVTYGTQLSLFVIFDKKSGWIRLADSAVGEVDLHDDSQFGAPAREVSSPNSHRKSRIMMDTSSSSGKWIPPALCELPFSAPGAPLQTMNIILLTRGRRTHILPSPLPSNSALHIPLRVVTWRNNSTDIVARIFEGSEPDMDGYATPAYLQLISLGELGVEVQEISLPSLLSKGKGKTRADDNLYAEQDTGGDAGFLCTGGHWDRQHTFASNLNRSYSTLSTSSSFSTDSTQLEREKGLYCWCRKGLEDFRVFWLGGSLTADYEDEEQ
ncbi:hypothetical protein J3R30DRAFT_3682343 [Lentinula aciculospora]|uniref:Uncharacterized protein n=1 Tax=Lentinula aciculospora TaxID=153920 RepID=A0A9W9ABQ4_9AGAR|nr:hypothetical protein J3R30DRAFT_3682343 [Lentinula aciculospora]